MLEGIAIDLDEVVSPSHLRPKGCQGAWHRPVKVAPLFSSGAHLPEQVLTAVIYPSLCPRCNVRPASCEWLQSCPMARLKQVGNPYEVCMVHAVLLHRTQDILLVLRGS